MTCVWDSLMRGVRDEDLTGILGLRRSEARARPEAFVEALKRRNRLTPDIKWQGETISGQQQRENLEWVRDYRTVGIRGGHLTSAADPFFFLLSDLLSVSVMHRHMQHVIRYDHPRPRYEICVRSDGGHMAPC